MSIALLTTLLQPLQAGLTKVTQALPQSACTHNCNQGRNCTCAARSIPRCVACGKPAGEPHKGSCPFKNFA